VDQVHVTLRDDFQDGKLPRITMLEVTMENLSINSRLARRPIRLGLRGQLEEGGSFNLAAQLDYRQEPAVRKYEIELNKVDLPGFADVYAASLPVRIESGKLNLSTELIIEGEAVQATNNVLLEGLGLELRGDSIFGLDPATSAKVIQGINRYGEEYPIVFGFLIDGPSSAPKFHWEKPLLEVAQKGLKLLGQRELQRYIDQLGMEIIDLEKMGESEVPLEEGFAQVQQAVQGLIAQQLGLSGREAEGSLQALQKLVEKLIGSDKDKQE
jgi:hypothetical protein